MSHKIAEALLKLEFPTIDTSTLLEVVNQTPNPDMAIELLCGIYEEPEITIKDRVISDKECTFLRYDKWFDRVYYTYSKAVTRGAYFPKGIDKKSINMENFDSLKLSSSDSDSPYLYIPTGETKLAEDFCSLSRWEKG